MVRLVTLPTGRGTTSDYFFGLFHLGRFQYRDLHLLQFLKLRTPKKPVCPHREHLRVATFAQRLNLILGHSIRSKFLRNEGDFFSTELCILKLPNVLEKVMFRFLASEIREEMRP